MDSTFSDYLFGFFFYTKEYINFKINNLASIGWEDESFQG